MGIQMYDFKDLDEWDQVVKSFDNYDVYYLSSYLKAFKINGDGEPALFFYQDKKIKAMNVVMKRDIATDERFTNKIPMNTLFDITTPYGYGGYLIEGDICDDSRLGNLNDEYDLLCKKEGIVCEFVRFHPVLNNVNHLNGIYGILHLGRTVTINLDSQEYIWNSLTSKNRNVIRKAEKMGVKVYCGRDPKLLEEFIPLYNKTMDKDEAKSYYYFKYEFYDSILTDLKYNSLFFYAMYENKIIAMAIIMLAKGKMHYHLSTTDVKYQRFAPSNLLLYEAACWGCEHGYNSFHLGGGLDSQEDSLFKFKAAFNKNSDTRFSIGRKIFDQNKYDELLNIRKLSSEFECNNSFFPKYRV